MTWLFIMSLIYLLLIAAIYFSKKKIDSLDNRIYAITIITNIFGLVLDFLQIMYSKDEVSPPACGNPAAFQESLGCLSFFH